MSSEFGESIGDGWRFLVSLIGLLLLIVGVGSVLLDARLTGEESLQVSALAVLSLILVASGWYIGTDISDSEDAIRVFAWMSVGVLALAALGAWFQIAIPTADSDFEVALLFLSALAAGALFGAVVGYYNVRVRTLVERASREETRREFLDEQQEALSALNSILRHQILNDLNAIGGHAELLETGRIESDEAARIVRQHSEHMEDVVGRIETVVDVLTLVTATDERSVDEALDRAIALLREDHPEATVDVVDGGTATVMADELLYLAFYEILDNAVVHGQPPVEVSVDAGPEDVVISIADAGSGIDVANRDSLFDPNTRGANSDGDGLGLFLATLIVDRYDGDVDIAEADRTTVEVRLASAGESI